MASASLLVALLCVAVPPVLASPRAGGSTGEPSCVIPSTSLMLQPQQPDTLRNFGRAVAVHGSWIAVGVRGGSSEPPGRVELFRRIDGAWTAAGVLHPASGTPGDGFGTALAMDEDTLVVGADSAHGAAPSCGVVHVYRLIDDAWQAEAQLMLPDGQPQDLFGSDVALDDDLVLIGAAQRDDFGSSSGAAYLFERTLSDAGVRWVPTASLFAPDAAAGDQFGYSVELADGIAAVGSIGDDDDASSLAGSVRIFEPTSDGWNQSVVLRPSSLPYPGAGPVLGRMLSVRSGTLLVNFGGGGPSGSGMLEMRRGPAGWSQPRLVTTGPGQSHQRHALALAPDASAAVWAAGTESSGTLARATILRRDAAGWFAEQDVLPPSPVPGATGITSVAFDGQTVVLGRTGSFDDAPGVVMVADLPPSDSDMNGLADDCELATGLAIDCDADGVLDERQMPFRFRVDNVEDALLLPTIFTATGAATLSALMLNHFVVTADPEPAIRSIAFVVPNFAAFGGDPDPITHALLLLYSDPDGDGLPTDATLLAARWTDLPAQGGFGFTTFDISPVEVGPPGTSFFAGVMLEFAPGHPFALIDDAAPHRQASWLSLGPAPLDPVELAANPPRPLDVSSGAPVKAIAFPIRVNLADCDSSGALDTCEILEGLLPDANRNLVADACETAIGDLDGDGAVDAADLAALLATWGPCDDPPFQCPADLDGDGDVDGADLGVLLVEWTG